MHALERTRPRFRLLLFLPVATRGLSAGAALRCCCSFSSPRRAPRWTRGSRAGQEADVLAQRGSRADAEKSYFAADRAVIWVLIAWPLWICSEANACPGAPLCASGWLRELRELRGAVEKTALPSSCSCSYCHGLGFPRRSW